MLEAALLSLKNMPKVKSNKSSIVGKYVKEFASDVLLGNGGKLMCIPVIKN